MDLIKEGCSMATDYVYDKWIQTIKDEKTCGLGTILQTSETNPFYGPLRVFVDAEGNMETSISNHLLKKQITEKLKERLSTKKPVSGMIELQTNEEETLSVFLDIYMPPVSIMIFGAGHDAIPVAKYSVSLGYRTTVVDARESYNNEVHFPNVERIIARSEACPHYVPVTNRTYMIIMNHHIEKDRDTLMFALQSSAPYIGVLGPRSRCNRMLEQLKAEGVVFANDQLEKMRNPVGLDIGGKSPEEIAISILAEIIAIQNEHKGGFLHGKNKIHKDCSLPQTR